jgi:hypothetical protein
MHVKTMPITHLHRSLQLNENEVIKLVLDTPANVFLLEGANYHLFMQDRPYESHGTEVETFPFIMSPPHPGKWELVIFSSTPGVKVAAEISIIDR